jgi:hypothetical protein
VGLVVLLCLVAFPLSCRRFGHAPVPAPATQPTAAPTTTTARAALAGSPASSPSTAPSDQKRTIEFANSGSGVTFRYPSSWKQKSSSEDVLLLVPVNGPESRSISLDEPALPPHIPGLIPMQPAHQDYLQDIKKKHPGLKVEDDKEHAFPKSKGRLIHCSWAEQGKTFDEVMLLLIHEDHVYLMSLDTERDAYPAARADFDEICNSWKWTK